MTSHAADYDGILQAELNRAFGEHDAGLRAAAIRDILSLDAVPYEPDRITTGHEAIEELQSSLPPAFVFSSIGPAARHDGLAHLRWQAGPPEAPAAMTRMDAARIKTGRIVSRHVFIDPPHT